MRGRKMSSRHRIGKTEVFKAGTSPCCEITGLTPFTIIPPIKMYKGVGVKASAAPLLFSLLFSSLDVIKHTQSAITVKTTER